MLKLLRTRAASWGLKIILGLIIVAFAFWGTDMIGSKRETVVAEVGKTQISVQEFDRSLREVLESLERIRGKPLNREEVKTLGVANQVLMGLLERKLLLQEAEAWGLRSSEEELRYRISSITAFQRQGRFDKDLYFAFLRQRGMTPQEFEKRLAEDLLAFKVQRTLMCVPFFGPKEAEYIASTFSEGLILEGILVKTEPIMASISPSDEELFKYYKDHQREFETPERVRVVYAYFRPEAFLGEVKVSDGELLEYYRAHIDQFQKPKTVRLAHIFLKDQKKAEEVLERLRRGEDFTALAKEFSEDPFTKQKGGDLGYIPLNELKPDLVELLSQMKVGEVKQYKTEDGYHIVKLLEEKPPVPIPFEQVKDHLMRVVAFERAKELCALKAADVAYKAKKEGGLEAYAKKAQIKLFWPRPFSRFEAVEGIGRSLKFIEAAFSLSTGEISKPVEEGGAFFVIQCLQKLPPTVPPFEEVKEKVREKLRAVRAKEVARSRAHAVLLAWKEGKLEETLRGFGLKVEAVGPIPRREAAYFLSEEVALLTEDKPFLETPLETRDGFLVLKLKEIKQTPTGDPKGVKEVLESFWGSQVIQAWLNWQMEKAKVKFNQKLLETYGVVLEQPKTSGTHPQPRKD